MAENESLDLRLSNRWFNVLRSICKGDPNDRVSNRILKTLQKAWQRTQQQLTEQGTSLQHLINTTLNQDDLSRLYRQTKRHDYVNLFHLEQQPFDTSERLMQRVVSASLQRVLDQFRDKLVGSDVCPNVGAWNELREGWLAPIRGEIRRFAERLAARPAVAVRVSEVPVSVGVDPSGGMLHVSLIQGDLAPVGARP